MTQQLVSLLRFAKSYVRSAALSSQELLRSSFLYRAAAFAGIQVPPVQIPPGCEGGDDDAHQLETCSALSLSLPSAGGDSWDGLLWMAAPKKRVSHSRKRMRMAHKYLKPIRHYSTCTTCGNFKLMHVLCGHCLKETLEKTAALRRQRLAKKENSKLKESALPSNSAK